MDIREISLDEYRQFFNHCHGNPFQSPEMYQRLQKGNKAPVIYGGFEDGNLKIALMGGKYPFKKLFQYIYCPYGPISLNPLDTELTASFFETLAKKLKKSRIVSIVMDPCIELTELDAFGKEVEGGFNNTWYRETMKEKGFLVPELHYDMTVLFNPRQVAVIDLAEIENYPGYYSPETAIEKYHSESDQLSLMKERNQRYIKNGMPSYIKIEEGTIDKLIEMGSMSGEAKDFDFANRQVLEDLKNGFQDKCRIRHCYLDVPAYREKIEAELAEIEQTLEEMKDKPVKKKRNMLMDKQKSLQTSLEDINSLPVDQLSLACGMFLLSDAETFFLFSGIDRRYRKYQAETWLNWEQIQDSLKRKVLRYNLLGIAGHYDAKDTKNEGLISYKRGLGAKIVEYMGSLYYPVQKQMTNMLKNSLEGMH